MQQHLYLLNRMISILLTVTSHSSAFCWRVSVTRVGLHCRKLCWTLEGVDVVSAVTQYTGLVEGTSWLRGETAGPLMHVFQSTGGMRDCNVGKRQSQFCTQSPEHCDLVFRNSPLHSFCTFKCKQTEHKATLHCFPLIQSILSHLDSLLCRLFYVQCLWVLSRGSIIGTTYLLTVLGLLCNSSLESLHVFIKIKFIHD